MNTNLRIKVLAAASFVMLGFAGCDKPASGPGPAQTAGQKVDKAVDKLEKKAEQASDKLKEQTAKAGTAIDDATITAAIKANILAEPGLKVLKIDVDTKNGIVMLTGSADSQQNVQKAGQVAAAVQGVKSVDNRLAVSSKS